MPLKSTQQKSYYSSSKYATIVNMKCCAAKYKMKQRFITSFVKSLKCKQLHSQSVSIHTAQSQVHMEDTKYIGVGKSS